MIDHKAALRALAAEDGCKASLLAAAHIEYIERQLVSSRNYSENLRRKLERVRHQRNELRRQLMEKEHDGSIVGCNDDRGAAGGSGGAAVEPV
jgi:F0F1-type ATP synthase gamma subunit